MATGKINLEWIPDAYAAKNLAGNAQERAAITLTAPIVKTSGLYKLNKASKSKKSKC